MHTTVHCPSADAGYSIVCLFALTLVGLSSFCFTGCAAAQGGAEAASQWDEPGEMVVAIAQPLVSPGDVDGNITRMAPMVAEAARRGAHMVVFSEAGITGLDHDGISGAAAVPLMGPVTREVD